MSTGVTAVGERRWRAALAALVVGSVLARGFFVARALSGPGMDDPDNYLPLARSLALGQGFMYDGRPTAYRPPLYPLLLAPAAGLLGEKAQLGVALLHLALGAGTVALTAAVGRRWSYSRSASLLAAGIVALDPVLVAQSRSIMTETLAAFLTTLSLLAVTRRGLPGAALGGFSFGLAALCRPSAWPALLLTAVASCFREQGTPWPRRLGYPIVLVLCAVATVSPWAIRNKLTFGSPIWTTTHGGYTLFLANNPVYYEEIVNGPPGAVWTGPRQAYWWDQVNRSVRGLSEAEGDRRSGAASVQFIKTHPRDFARASLQRLGRFWGLAPAGAVYPGWLRVLSACWTLPLWLLFAVGLCTRSAWQWPRSAAPAAVMALTVVHSIYWTDMRMRAPVVPAIAVIAAGTFARPRAAEN